MAEDLRICMIQTEIVWENPADNLRHFGELLRRAKGRADLAILPETFTTGFSMNAAQLAEPTEGETLRTLRRWAADYDLAIVGSFIASAEGKTHNRAFFVTPEGEAHFYDKRHLFRMAGEAEHFSAGEAQQIVRYRDWNICLQVCYDLRFPVWSRNVDNAYDLLIYVANWPVARQSAWEILLPARAAENLAYVCGVNRTGVDGKGFAYGGGSAVYDPKGKKLADCGSRLSIVRSCTLSRASLDRFRTKFPAWMDADKFCCHE